MGQHARMVGQLAQEWWVNIGRNLQIALEKLQQDIFVEADFYEGDLLANVLDVETTFWTDNKNYWTLLNNLISNKRQEIIDMEISTTKFDSVEL